MLVPLTPQQVFDNGLHGVINQGGFSKVLRRGVPFCFYRHPDLPLKCAIGHSIPDSVKLRGRVNEGPLWVVTGNRTSVELLFSRVHYSLIRKIQDAHDFAETLEEFRWKMKLISAEAGLKFNPPSTSFTFAGEPK